MSKTKRIFTILKGVVMAYMITFILILIYSAILTYTSVPETTIPTCVFVISMISVFIASSIMVIKVKENGLKNGGLLGLIYIVLLYILSSTTSSGFALTGYAIATMIFNILLGMVGGIIGVNIAK
ncbi:MAG: TIGR04086 family membrane protein [Clostridia bacterium]|nr:TIGR04086 family membrane protein [Clostridia bacterium]